jgi:hypothetical protein
MKRSIKSLLATLVVFLSLVAPVLAQVPTEGDKGGTVIGKYGKGKPAKKGSNGQGGIVRANQLEPVCGFS